MRTSAGDDFYNGFVRGSEEALQEEQRCALWMRVGHLRMRKTSLLAHQGSQMTSHNGLRVEWAAAPVVTGGTANFITTQRESQQKVERGFL